jgi:hypothetical protein
MIRVVVKDSELCNVHPEMVEFAILHKLKDAGMPVIGTFAPKFDTNAPGVLSVFNDPEIHGRVFTYEECNHEN